MSGFPTTKVNDFSANDDGVDVKDILTLISASKYYDEIYKALEVERFIDQRIKIPGAKTLVQRVDAESKRFLKFDVQANYYGLKFRYLDDDEGYEINNAIEIHFDEREKIDFINPVSDEIRQSVESAVIKALPKYSAQSSFLESLHGMNKYAKDLASESLKPIVLQNFLMLEEAYRNKDLNLKHLKGYRLLRDTQDGQYYFRALITDVYKDYNIGVSVFITLMSLHQITVDGGAQYSVKSFVYNESYVRVLFEEEGGVKIPKLGTLSFLLELKNSELGDGAVKINGLYSLTVERKDGEAEATVYLQSRKRDNAASASISHKDRPQTAIRSMNLSDGLKKGREELIKDLTDIATEDPKRILSRFRDKVKSSQTIAKGDKNLLNNMLDKQIEDFYDLLQLMENAEELVEAGGYDVLEHLRYLAFYAYTERL